MEKKRAWVISVDMGYGHQRAAFPLRDIAYEGIITANNDKIVTPDERKHWRRFRRWYENISRMRNVPFIGNLLWMIYGKMESISPFYPFRDLSKPNIGSMYMHRLIKKGFFSSLSRHMKTKKIPIVSTFFATALAAAHHGIKDVYCVVTDSDINRVWVPENPKKDRIIYLTPSNHGRKRLIAYGIPKNRIFFTGFPLPKILAGENLKKNLGARLPNLDPKGIVLSEYKETLKKKLGKHFTTRKSHILTLTYAVGGAGAQKEQVYDILASLATKLVEKKMQIILIAGMRSEIEHYFKVRIEELGLSDEIGKSIQIISALNKNEYFDKFNEVLQRTDILWTKPSELSFYIALGIPIIISPPLGAHEVFNKKWILRRGGGFPQEDPRYTKEWLFEWLNNGMLAEAAFDGYTRSSKHGTENIKKIIFAKNKADIKLKY